MEGRRGLDLELDLEPDLELDRNLEARPESESAVEPMAWNSKLQVVVPCNRLEVDTQQKDRPQECRSRSSTATNRSSIPCRYSRAPPY